MSGTVFRKWKTEARSMETKPIVRNLVCTPKGSTERGPKSDKQSNKAENVCSEEITSINHPKAMQIASDIHENWRKTSGYSVRIKPVTEDSAWILEKGVWCDIQNTIFGELPSDWKKVNYQMALLAIDTVCEEQDIEAASAMLHKKWLDCNPSVEPHLDVPYDELAEKDKDTRRYI
ncbi:hypothetical protein J3B02_005723, partial [Coemansia erecta]